MKRYFNEETNQALIIEGSTPFHLNLIVETGQFSGIRQYLKAYISITNGSLPF